MNGKNYLFTLIILLGFSGYVRGQAASFIVDGDTNLSVVRVCKGYTIDFIDNSTGIIQIYSWVFPGGSPTSSSLQSPSVVFNTNGTYNCSFTISYSGGLTNTISFQVKVSSNVTNASFGFLPSVCSSDPAYLLTTGNPSGGSYFGTGVSNNRFNPAIADTGFHTLGYVYSAPNGCRDTAYSTVYVKPGPKAALLELSSFSNCNAFSFANPNFLITIFDISTSPDSIVKHEVIWGDGTLKWDSTGFRTTGLQHTYYGQGIYQLKYVVTSGNGCTDTAVYSVLNTTNPASLNITNPGGTNGCAPVTVTFPLSTTNSDSTITYTVDWGDGTDTSFNHPPPATLTHTYDTTSCLQPGGFFNITAISKNACVTTQSTVAGPFVTQPAIAEFAPLNGCVNQLHSLPNMSVPGFDNACSRLTTFKWDWGDGSPFTTVISSAPIPPPGTHIWTAKGYYNVTLWVISPGSVACPGDSITYVVCIGDAPKDSIVFTDSAGCAPYQPLFNNNTDTSTYCGSSTFGWYVNDSTGYSFINGTSASDFDPDIQFTVPGVYLLSFYNINECGGDTVTQKIIVQGPPIVNLPPNPFPYCDTVKIRFATDSLHTPTIDSNYAAITSYSWSITPSGFTYLNGTDSTSQFPEILLVPNTYTIIINATNACGSDADTQIVVVNSLTNGGFLIDNLDGCAPLTVNVKSTSTSNIQHKWYINGVLYSTFRDTNMILTNTGLVSDSIYLIELEVTSGLGCSDTIKEWVTVRPTPQPNFSFTSACISDTTFFYDSTLFAYAPLINWSWDFGDNTTSKQTNPYHIYTNPGRYLVTLSAEDTNGCIGYYSDSVWVKSKPIVDFNFSYTCLPDSACVNDTVFLGNLSTIDSNGTPINGYGWDVYNDGIIDDTTRHSYWLFPNPGLQDVKLIVSSQGGCVDTIVKQIFISQPPNPQFTLSQKGGCTPFSVSVTEFSTGYITNYLWNFYTVDSFGNQTQVYTSTLKNPNPLPSFVANGLTNTTVYASLTASNCCASTTYTDTISVFPIPIPVFNISSDTGCSPLTITIQVDGNVTGQPDSIIFDFGDGSALFRLNPNINILPNGDTLYTWNQQTHTFVYNGNSLDTTYYITLRGINECGDSTYTVPILVKTKSVQSFFTASTNYACGPLLVSFIDNSFNALNVGYCFDFDTITNTCLGTSVVGRNVSWTYTQPGKYVIAQFSNNVCGKDTSYQIVEVLPKPNPSIAFNANVCENDPVVFTNNTTISAGNILGTRWDFGDGDTSIISSPTHVFDSAGVYYVCLQIITDAGCDTSICDSITVHNKPVPLFTFLDNQCLNQQPIQFLNNSTNSPGNITSYEWDFGDGNLSNQVSPQNTYALAGTYDVKLKIINDNNCADSLILPITILPVPVSDFTFSFQSGDSCGVPQTVDFVNNSNSAGGYVWDFESNISPNLNTSTVTHPSYTFTKPGTYEVKLVATNGYACSDTIVKKVIIYPNPTANFVALNNSGCAPLRVDFDNKTTLPIGFNDKLYYTWYFGDGDTSHAVFPAHTYKYPGNYTVALTVVTENGCSDSLVKISEIKVFPVPNPTYSFQVVKFGIYDFKQNSLGGTPPYSYNWDFGDGLGSTAKDPRHEFIINQINWNQGFYVCLTITDVNGCDSTVCDTLNIGAFTLFVPNAMAPSANGDAALFLPKGQGLETYNCMIFDRWGNLIWSSDKLDPVTASPTEGWDGTVDGVPVPTGVYVWKIEATFENGGTWRRFDENGELGGNTGTITILR